MDTSLPEHQNWLSNHGYQELGQVSPFDHYWVHPKNCELVHLLHTHGGWLWFFNQYPLEDVFALLVACVHYAKAPGQVADEDRPLTSFLARDRMAALFPTFPFFGNGNKE